MLFEDILLLLGFGASVFFIGVPIFKFIRAVTPTKRDPVKEAKQRLEVAKATKEAALLDKQADQVYEELYQDVLDDEETTNNRRRV